VLSEISTRLLVMVAWSAAVVGFNVHVARIVVPSTVHGLIGVALGLLLVFRTNASYDRFWEGRKLWGGIVNEARNLARLTSVLMSDNPSLRRETIQWAILFPYSVMYKLRGTELEPLGAETDLSKPDFDSVAHAQHSSLAIAVKLTGCIDRARRTGVLGDIQQLVDYLGACERIHKTPLPFAYVVHLRRALVLYCLTVPFALIDPFGWWTVLASALISFVFFGIEEIGVEIEDPFGLDPNDLPLERICDTIRKNLAALV
jgi:putative membrane protein